MGTNNGQKKFLLVSPHLGVTPPLGIGYIASYFEAKLPELKVDISILRPGKSSVEEILKKSPDVVGFSCMILDYKNVRSWAEKIKEAARIPIIIGGPYITPIPQTLDPVFDIAVLREGEVTTLELFEKYLERDGFSPEFLKDIQGVAYHDNGNVVINSDRPLIEPLDSIPPPARHLMNMERYTAPTDSMNLNPFRGPMRLMTIQTSRGCPYDCTYCQAKTFWKKYRMFSADYIASEMEGLLEKYTFDTVHVADDLFIASKARLKNIVEHFERNGWNKKLEFWVAARANLFTEEVCELLKRLNVFHVAFGFESNSPEVLKKLKKNTSTVEQNERSVRLAKKYGFEVEGAFLIGSPEETLEDMQSTYDFIKRSPIDAIGVGILAPLPGTELWDYAVEKGKVDLNMDISELFPVDIVNNLTSLSKYGERAFLTDEVSKEEFIKMYKKFVSLWIKKGSYGRIRLVAFFKPSNWKYIVSHPLNVLYLLSRQLYRDFVMTHPSAGAYLVRFKALFSEK